jgi:hypothetical protein
MKDRKEESEDGFSFFIYLCGDSCHKIFDLLFAL